jgi:hypothetical protein
MARCPLALFQRSQEYSTQIVLMCRPCWRFNMSSINLPRRDGRPHGVLGLEVHATHAFL